MSKIGIFGGTFDPIHNGHLKIAAAARAQYGLDRVIFLTSGNPPHKRGKKILDARLRHIMVKRAIAGTDGFEADDWEVRRGEYSYTSDALAHYAALYPHDDLFFIIGGDSLRDFNTWHEPAEILRLSTLLVYNRPGVAASADFALPVSGAAMDVSATEIRAMAEAGEDITPLVPPEAAGFIARNGIYKYVGNFEEKLAALLKPDRLRHSLGVRDTAVRLAKIYGADEEKAAIAGLLHDNAKNLPDQLGRCADLEVELDPYERANPALVHAPLGAETAKCAFGITDPDIISAIRWHTVGRPGMTLLEKIIFTADLIEPGRDFPDAPALREIALRDLDAAVLACTESTVAVNKSRGVLIHPNAEKILSGG